MQKVLTPPNQRLVWYLAMEEYLASSLREERVFFWSVSPTVIYGRHQVLENEVNIDFCERNGVSFYRRKSGGGCVYADRGNLMVSYLSPSPHSEQVFAGFLSLLSGALQKLGFPAVMTMHNDVLIDGRKVSGNACYALQDATIVHGTLLWDVDFDMLSQAITPSREKLQKHGVESVRQRVVNLKSLCAGYGVDIVSLDDLEARLSSILCTSERRLSADDLCGISQIESSYLSPDFIYGRQLS